MDKLYRILLAIFAISSLMPVTVCAAAQDGLAPDAAYIERSTFVSVGDRILAMDKDRDGMVTVYEVRAFIEARHGKAYLQDVLNDMESSADGKSCSTPFAKPLY